MKTFIVQLIVKEAGTKNKVKIKAKRLSEKAVGNIEQTFVEQMVQDPSYLAKEEMLEGLEAAKAQLIEQPKDER